MPESTNAVFLVQTRTGDYFFKAFTRNWYGAATAGAVKHEVGAYRCLTSHDIPSAEIIGYSLTNNNPSLQPFMLTRKIEGASMTKLFKDKPSDYQLILEACGRYLKKAHEITFDYPGYIYNTEGPNTPLKKGDWQHPAWHVQSGQVPRFSLVDCNVQEFIVLKQERRYIVNGFVDMEVASAGDPTYDFVKLAMNLMVYCRGRDWWQPLFRGYGSEPDFSHFQKVLMEVENSTKLHHWTFIEEGQLQTIEKNIGESTNWAEIFNPFDNLSTYNR